MQMPTHGAPGYCVDVDGLGEVGLTVLDLTNLVTYIPLSPASNSTCPLCGNYIGFQVSTGVEDGNLTGQVLQLDSNIHALTAIGKSANVSTTSYFVACSLSAATTFSQLSVQDGQIIYPNSSLDNSDKPWTIWSPEVTTNSSTELVNMFNIAQATYSIFPEFCEIIHSSDTVQLCAGFTSANLYINYLLGIPTISGSVVRGPSIPSVVLTAKEMENAVAETAATFLWLAGVVGSDGGFQPAQGESLIFKLILELRLNVNTTPVVIGLLASITLLVMAVWILHYSHSEAAKISVISTDVLGLMWMSAHSSTLHNLMEEMDKPISDQLRLKGMKVEVCLADLESEPEAGGHQLASNAHSIYWKEYSAKGQFSIHCWCYYLHGLFLILHGVLIILLLYHPKHHITMLSDSIWVTTSLSICLQAFYVLYTAGLVFFAQQLAVHKIITQRHCLTVLNDITQAWTSIGASVYALWQQTGVSSSPWRILGVVVYLACVSTLHIASSTIMQFTAFNSTSTVSVQSAVAWTGNPIFSNISSNVVPVFPPDGLSSNFKTTGLHNNTVYDILDQTGSGFTSAVVNATSFQVNCGLLSNLSFSNAIDPLGFSMPGLGTAYLSFQTNLGTYQSARNQIVCLQLEAASCGPCQDYLFLLITTDVALDESIKSTEDLSVNIAQDGGSPIMGYVAACSVSTQTTLATLDMQSGTLTPSSAQIVSQPWKLWSPSTEEASSLLTDLNVVFYQTAFGICPGNNFVGCSVTNNASLLAEDNPLYMLYPNQLEQGIEQSIATLVWTTGQIGKSRGGFDRMSGESQVEQVVTMWRLNINTLPVGFASASSLILFVLAFIFVRVPSRSRIMKPQPSVTGLSVLETLWIAAHSQTVREQMEEVDNPSLDNLRKAGMFQICLGDVHGSQRVASPESDSEALLE